MLQGNCINNTIITINHLFSITISKVILIKKIIQKEGDNKNQN